MPGGLLSLVCYGNENVIVNGNPDVTWFYKSFLRHTHFSQEPIQIGLDGPNQLLMDAPILLKAKIPRQGDLLSDLVLRMSLPDIFSKAYIHDVSGVLVLDRKYEFAWVRQIGVRMIDTVRFTIGGQIIQEFTSDWIMARALLDYDDTQYQKWRYMVGDIPDLFDPAQGMYSDPCFPPGQGYPNVMAWRGVTVQNNAPSIRGRVVRVPLGLWFSDFIQNSLPLIALQYHECEVQIQMRPIRDLYTILDPSGIRLRYGIQSLPYLPSDQYTGIWSPAYGPLPPFLNNLYGGFQDPQGSMKHFLTDISGNVPTQDGWPLNATLEATYTFVQDNEQQMFSQKTLRYNVRQVQNFVFTGVQTRASYRLDVHNITTRVVFFARRSDVGYRNQPTNLTNWMYPQGGNRPFVFPLQGMPDSVLVKGHLVPISSSGLNVPGIQRQIIRSAFFMANGTPLYESQDAGYFTEYAPFRYLKGSGTPFQQYGLAAQSEMWPIHTYSFALKASDVEQPTGTLNTSRIDRLDIDVDVEPIPVSANYTYDIYVFAETLNFLEISSGLAGLKFAR